MSLKIVSGKYTLEIIATELGIKKNSAINLLSKLKKEGKVIVTGGGRQKRIYTVSNIPIKQGNGFFKLVNKYSPDKLVPHFIHCVHGKYTVERAIIDGIIIGDVRTLEATRYLFKQVENWKLLFQLAKQHGVVNDVYKLYKKARKNFKCRTMPKKYKK